MGKKYLNTKDGSIEQSILDVWQEAAEMHAEGMDGRTKEYRSHRGKLESNRAKQENKKNSVKTEQPETQHGSGEHAFEVGTDRYREHTQKVTPGQMEEGIIGNLAKAGAKAVVKKIKSTAKSAYGKTIVGKAQSAVSKKVKKVGSAIKGVKKAAKTGEEVELDEDNMDLMRKAAKGAMQTIKFKDGKLKMDSFTASGIMAVYDKVNPKNKVSIEKMINSGTKAQIMKLQSLAMKSSKGGRREDVDLDEMEKENMTENLNLRDTIKNLWVEAASSAVNPNDREELDIDVKNSAKKMKRAKEPAPNVSEEVELDEASGDKEAYQKFFNATLKKFKVSSPAELKGDDKKKFFDYIDKNWEADNEKAEELIQLAKEFKVSSMREALAKVWGLDEGELPPALKKAIDAKKKDKEEKDEDKEIKGNKTLTGKKAAVVEIDPGLKTKK